MAVSEFTSRTGSERALRAISDVSIKTLSAKVRVLAPMIITYARAEEINTLPRVTEEAKKIRSGQTATTVARCTDAEADGAPPLRSRRRGT